MRDLTIWILKRKSNTFYLLFLSPILFTTFSVFPVFAGNTSNILCIISGVIGLSILLYFIFTVLLFILLQDLNKLNTCKLSDIGFYVLSFLNITFISILLYQFIENQLKKENFENYHHLIPAFIFSETIRLSLVSMLILKSESNKKPSLLNFLSLFFMLMNPLIGLWNLHLRINNIISKHSVNFRSR